EARKRAEPIPEQDEDLLLAPPIGMVPILTPPPPPSANAVGAQFLALNQSTVPNKVRHDNRGTSAQFIAPNKLPHDQISETEDTETSTDNPVQLDLFNLPEPAAETVRRLRLPGGTSGEPIQIIEEATTKSTNTMI